MSSPLDGRIRAIARAEAEQAVKDAGAPGAAGADGLGLQQQVTDLHEHLHHAVTAIGRLEARIAALEGAAGQTGQEQRPAGRRTARKDTSG